MSTIVFDIETGASPEMELRKLYQEPTLEEFSVKCDARWKPETVQAKFAEQKGKGWEEFCGRAALSPLTGRVLAIGVRGASRAVIIGEENEQEDVILEEFWSLYAKYHAEHGRFIGFNCAGFDVPFLVRRSWLHGVRVPESVYDRGRYLSSTFVDLMLLWAAGTRDSFVSLDTLARFFAIGCKPDGCDGATFGPLWTSGNAESRATAAAYLVNDLDMTWRLAERMGVIS